MASAVETQHVDLNAVTLAYSDDGSGPVVLYAHGLTSSRAVDAGLGFIDFAPLKTRARLVAYDARGHGASTGAPQPADYVWPSLADDMLALAEHVSAHAPVSAIGLSMGTGTLLHAVLKSPARFERLVLTAPPTAWSTRAPQRELYENLAALVERSSPETLAKYFSKALVAPIFRDVPGYPPTPDIAHALLPAVFRGAGMSDLPAPEQLRTIEQPTLILAWDTDSAHPVSTAEQLAQLIPDAQLHVSKTSQDIRGWGARIASFLGK